MSDRYKVMYGPPKPTEGLCNAHLYIGDDYGDNSATMQCGLPEGHGGEHKESFKRRGHDVVITWVVDERPTCAHCSTVGDTITIYDYDAVDPEFPDWKGDYIRLCRSCCEEHYTHLNYDNPHYDPTLDEYETEEETPD